ncbi:Uncharacterised protein [Escherichia coli]|nr:Uncharacterised protein [Escherichia coli]
MQSRNSSQVIVRACITVSGFFISAQQVRAFSLMGLGLNASSALTVVMKCSSLKQPEDKHLASQHKPQERPINGSPYGEHSVEEEAWPEP